MRFQNLTDIHTARDAQRVQDNIHWCAIFQEGHIFHRHNFRDNTFVAVATGHLIAFGQAATLGNTNSHNLFNPGSHIAMFVTVKDLDIDDLTALAVGQPQRAILHFARLLTEDRTQQFLFWGQFSFTLGGNLADQNVTGYHFGTNADNAIFVEIFQGIFTDVRDITGDLFRP